jgi:hypothetical protein
LWKTKITRRLMENILQLSTIIGFFDKILDLYPSLNGERQNQNCGTIGGAKSNGKIR